MPKIKKRQIFATKLKKQRNKGKLPKKQNLMSLYCNTKCHLIAYFTLFSLFSCQSDLQKKDNLHKLPNLVDTTKVQILDHITDTKVTKKSQKTNEFTTKNLTTNTAFLKAGLVNVQQIDSNFVVDLRYATTNNFVGKNMYGNLSVCYLQPSVAQMLQKAQQYLQQQHPNYRLLMLDCARPLSVQTQLWNVVKGTPKQKYVASPAKHSIHNYGVAIDLTIIDLQTNTELDMGTPYDFLGKLAQPRYNKQHLSQGKLTQQQVDNRNLLRSVMVKAAFRPIPNEWWHFDGYSLAYTKSKFKVIK